MTKKRQKAFSLIELLVVIAIAMLLLSIILPSVKRAKEIARRAVCLCNLRHMGIAANAYLTEHDGYFPPALYGMYSGGPCYGWDFTKMPDGTYRPGLIWASMDCNIEIQQCPSMSGNANWAGDPYTGYNYNTSYIGGPTEPLGGWELAGGMPELVNVINVKTPAECVIFGDGSYGTGSNKFMRSPFEGARDTDIPPTGATRGAGCQGFLHLSTSNASFVDGHARWFDTPYKNTYPEARRWISAIGGFLSEDNRLYDLE